MRKSKHTLLNNSQAIDLIREWRCEIHADRMVCRSDLSPLLCDKETVVNQIAKQIDFSNLAVQTLRSIPVIGALFIKT
jgi:hypothetical protein